MDVPIKRYLNILVTEYFAECFYFHSGFNAPRGKCVSECVEMNVFQLTGSGNFTEIVSESDWFNKSPDFTRKQESALRHILIILSEKSDMLF